MLRIATSLGLLASIVLLGSTQLATGGGDIVVDTIELGGATAGNCGLDEAISAANTDTQVDGCDGQVSDTITFDLGAGTPMITVAVDEPLPAITAPVTILGNTGGATRVELRGPTVCGNQCDHGLVVEATAPGTLIDRLVVSSFPNAGILLRADDVTVTGSFIGTNADGTMALGNYYGISADGVDDALIGGTSGVSSSSCTGDCNLISGNEYGVFLGTRTLLRGNFIGTNASGSAAVPNVSGVNSNGDQADSVVGGTAAGAGNLISGNTEYGIYSYRALTIQGNRIGTNASGVAGIPNGPNGATYGAITLDGANGGFAEDATLIGGSSTAAANTISGNNGSGIVIRGGAMNVAVEGNLIGTASDGESPLGNLATGIYIYSSSSGNSVGGLGDGEGNVIAFNNRGVRVDGGGGPATSNSIRGNSIHANIQQGINLVDGGNNDLAPPEITGAGSAFGTACPNCEVDIFSDDADEGRVYEGTVTADGSGAWTFSGGLSGPMGTATNTDASGNTSEFSAPFLLPLPTPTPSPTASPEPTPTPTPTDSPQPTPTASPTPAPTATPTPTAGPSETPGAKPLQGDVQCDDDVDSVDALQQLRSVASLSTFQEDDCPAIGSAGAIFGDVDCDGDVDSVDALKVLRHVAALSVTQTEPCPDIGDPL